MHRFCSIKSNQQLRTALSLTASAVQLSTSSPPAGMIWHCGCCVLINGQHTAAHIMLLNIILLNMMLLVQGMHTLSRTLNQ